MVIEGLVGYGCRNGAKFNILKLYSYSTFIHSYSTFVFVFSINFCFQNSAPIFIFNSSICSQTYHPFRNYLSIQQLFILLSCTLVLLYLFGLKDSGQAEGSTLCSLVCSDDIQQAVVVLSGVSWDMWLIWELEKEFIQLSFEKFQATV